jgi:hypothetical protein
MAEALLSNTQLTEIDLRGNKARRASTPVPTRTWWTRLACARILWHEWLRMMQGA